MDSQHQIQDDTVHSVPTTSPSERLTERHSARGFGKKIAQFILGFVGMILADIVFFILLNTFDTKNIGGRFEARLIIITVLAIHAFPAIMLSRAGHRSIVFGIVAAACFFLLVYGGCMLLFT